MGVVGAHPACAASVVLVSSKVSSPAGVLTFIPSGSGFPMQTNLALVCFLMRRFAHAHARTGYGENRQRGR